MQIVILCGGKGSRLKEITKKIPKPMLLFNKKPFVERIINYLNNQGFNDFLLLCGYKSSQIINYFKKKKLKYNINFSIENKPLGTGGAIVNAKKLLNKQFILLNGDSFLPEKYKKIINKFKKTKKNLVILVYKNKSNSQIKNNIFIHNGKLKYYSKNKSRDFNYVDAGVYLVNKNLLNKLKKNNFSFEDFFFQKLINKNQIDYFETENFFYDIGTKEKLTKYRKKLKVFFK
tara:strand:+ start:701 stop:1393 length:693 start_codon:yes stop_codon:yes gene_type:complete